MDCQPVGRGMSRRSQALSIRAGQPHDARAIASVLCAAFVEYESRYTPQAYAATTPSIEDVKRRFMEGPIWVALLDDAVVGTVSVVPRRKALYVRSLAVVPEARGQSTGGALLGHVEGYAVKHNYAYLILSTTPFLAEAIRLYESWGFRPGEEGPSELFGTPLLTMTKPLAPVRTVPGRLRGTPRREQWPEGNIDHESACTGHDICARDIPPIQSGSDDHEEPGKGEGAHGDASQ